MKKTSLLVGLLGLFFIFFWYMQNAGYIWVRPINRDILLAMNGSLQGFSSLRAFAVYYTLLFLLFSSMRMEKETPTSIILQKSRTDLYTKGSFNILVSALLFAFIFSIVNLGMSCLFIGNEKMITNHFYTITLLNSIGLIFSIGGLAYWKKRLSIK
ncbi:WxPxxD family membrane protein [Terrilactibacillus sp. S3-3]|nr:WxPxxD family membrane protein [Terrilactibacillus sp. S3-3]